MSVHYQGSDFVKKKTSLTNRNDKCLCVQSQSLWPGSSWGALTAGTYIEIIYFQLCPATLAKLIMAFSAPLNWPCVQSLGKAGLKKTGALLVNRLEFQSSISWRLGLVIQESGKFLSSSLLQCGLAYLHRPLSWCCAGMPAASEGVTRQGGALLLWVEFVAPHSPERADLPLTSPTQTQDFLICTLCLQTGS